MIPAKIKNFFLSQACGVILCLIALFLIGDTLYLNTVRDQKAGAVDTISQALDDYQLELGHARKGNAGLPEVLNQDFQYGALLKTTLSLFKSTGKDITVSKIKLTEVEKLASEANSDMLAFPAPSHKKKKETQRVHTFQISGAVNSINQPEPYSQLNEVIAQIKTETGCQFSLVKAGEDSEQKTTNQILTFDIQLNPSEQKVCGQKFTRLGGDS